MKTLIVFAMKEEAQDFFKDVDSLLFVGLGKVNAAYHLTQYLKSNPKPDLVLNFGSAGSNFFKTKTLVECSTFIQRDMDLTALGFERGITPFENTGGTLEVPKRFPNLPNGICGTGDSFDVTGLKQPWNVMDMEAYAFAKVCMFEKIPFACVKYITDGADGAAHTDWAENLPEAAKRFREVYEELD